MNQPSLLTGAPGFIEVLGGIRRRVGAPPLDLVRIDALDLVELATTGSATWNCDISMDGTVSYLSVQDLPCLNCLDRM